MVNAQQTDAPLSREIFGKSYLRDLRSFGATCAASCRFRHNERTTSGRGIKRRRCDSSCPRGVFARFGGKQCSG